MTGVAPIWHLSTANQVVAGTIFSVGAAAGIVYAAQVIRAAKSLYPLFIMIGATLVIFVEPLDDLLSHAMFPELHMLTVVHAYGRGIPLYVLPAEAMYIGPGIIWIAQRLSAGISLKQWWRYYLIGAVLGAAFEQVPIHLKWWVYYGSNQGLSIAGYPIWQAFVDVGAMFLTAAIVYTIIESGVLSRAWQFGLLLWVPVGMQAFVLGIGLPALAAINSTSNRFVTNIAALLTLLLAFFLIEICGRLLRTNVNDPEDVSHVAT
jgi:hypothetical protein